MKVDYLIVGNGVAGTVLSFLLYQQNKSFLVIDDPAEIATSHVSAGICNPIVFRRLTKSWMASRLIKRAREVYGDFEKLLNEKLIEQKDILKIITSNDELQLWEKKTGEAELMDFISFDGEQLPEELFHRSVNIGKVEKGAKVSIGKLIGLYKGFLESKGMFMNEKLHVEDLTLNEGTVKWKGIEAGKIVFCEGYKLSENPFFNWLPLVPVKGEALVIKSELLKIDFMVNRKTMLCPLGNDLYWVGGTYSWKELDEIPTDSARKELVSQLERIIKVPYEIVDHLAAVRPTVIDRRPLIGLHPEFSQLAIFNGLGTKGTMISPYFATHFIAFLENGGNLDKEINIERFYQKYIPANR